MTLTGAQLDAILVGSGTINLGSGTGDTINLTSTSADLNTFDNASIQGVEAISAATAAAGVTITLAARPRPSRSPAAAGRHHHRRHWRRHDRGGRGDDTINIANGQFAPAN